MKKENFYTDNADIQYHLEKRTDWEPIFNLLTDEEKEAVGASTFEEYLSTWREVLSTVGEVCGSSLAPNAGKVETEELKLEDGEVVFPPTLTENLQTLLEVGLAGTGIPPKHGGLGAPFIIEILFTELLNRACPSTAINACWWSSIAHILHKYGTPELCDEVVPHIAAGEWSGSMALTEPDAGSDLSNIRTYGDLQEDGTWKIHGSKTFISNGNGQVCLLLAKNKKGAEGLKALNLYMCLRKIGDKDNFKVTKLEEKIALHGSATCEMTFEGSEAVLLGKDGEGLKMMFTLMNEARIAVSYQGVGQMEAAFRLAHNYAHERKTWGKPIAEHELIAEKLLDMEVNLKAIRSLCYKAAWNMTLMELYGRKLKQEGLSDADKKELKRQVAKHSKRVRRWTPLLKYWVGENSFQHARTGLQIHGGYGFSTEYKPEWWLRESLILSIYEGTSQIQALMVVKDTMKDVIRAPNKFIEVALGLKLKALSSTDPMRRKLSKAKQLASGAVIAILFRLLKTNARTSLSENKSKDVLKMIKILSKDMLKFENISFALLHAEKLAEMKAIVALAEAVVWDYEADSSRRWVAERYLNTALPRLQYLKSQIETNDPVIAARIGGDLEANLAEEGTA